MINKDNSSYYLRYLIKKSETRPISYTEIPKPFQDYFSLPALSQSLNISMKYPDINFDKVEDFFDEYMFQSYEDLIEAIKDTFQTTIDKLYAVYYYTTNNIKYDHKRSLHKFKKLIAIEKLFKIQKGVCYDYCIFFIQLAKQVGITSEKMKMMIFGNHPKTKSFDRYHPPKNPCITHDCVFIEYKNQQYICDPTWGAGYTNENNEFIFKYSKSFFLIPLCQAVLIYYPKDMPKSSIKYHFTFNQFKSLNKPNLKKELSYESDPFQVIQVKNGFHEMQFSFIQPSKELSSQFHFLKNKTWNQYNNIFVCFKCVSKNAPNHCYSVYPDRKRCRYKMSVSFPMPGTWRVKVFVDTKYLFEVYYEVENTSTIIKQIPGYHQYVNGFHPIFPTEGLTTIDNGIATIRFVIKMKRSPLLVYFYQIKRGTFERKNENSNDNSIRFNYVTLDLPFENDENNNSKKRLVENWMKIEFNKIGRWEVFIYFKNDDVESNNYTYGVKYYFDVTGISKPKNNLLIYDVPITRTFVPFYKFTESTFKVKPSSSTIILNKTYDFYFHIKYEKKNTPNAHIDYYDNNVIKTIFPVLIYERLTDDKNIIDRKYSITLEKSGYYELMFFIDSNYVGTQKYFLIDSKLQNESLYEKKLMKTLQNEINGTINYTNDVDKRVKENVLKMCNSLIRTNKIKNSFENTNVEDEIEININEKVPKNKEKKFKQKKVIENDAEIDLLKEKIIELEQAKKSLSVLLKDKEKQINDIKRQHEEKISELSNKIIEMEKTIENNIKHQYCNRSISCDLINKDNLPLNIEDEFAKDEFEIDFIDDFDDDSESIIVDYIGDKKDCEDN